MRVTTTEETVPATQSTAPSATTGDQDTGAPAAALVTTDLLVEDVSIDGMCGVY